MDHPDSAVSPVEPAADGTRHQRSTTDLTAPRPRLGSSRRRRFGLALPAAALLTALSVGVAPALTSGFLPGGTPLTVDNTSPVAGTEFNVPGTTIDITDAGTATIGAGVPITAVYAVDTSGSMVANAGVDCTGDAVTDTRMVCAQEGVSDANQTAADPLSPVTLTGLASFASTGATHDVDLGAAGTQLIVAPAFDGNGNAIPDLEDAAFALAPAGQTNYADGLTSAFAVINDAANTNTTNLLLFLSDADDQSVMVGVNISTLALSVPAGTTIHTFALGTGPTCIFDGGTGSLNDIAALSTAGVGTCTQVSDVSQLGDLIEEAIGSTLESLEISVDGGAFSAIPAGDIDITLPANGDFLVKVAPYETPVNGLGVGDHTICVRATGTDAGGTASVTDCKTIHLLKLTLEPATEDNELGTDNEHAVTATLLGDAAYVAANPRVVDFTVGGANAGETGTCSPNADCTTDASGVVTFTYDVPVAPGSLGTDSIEACLEIDGEEVCETVEKHWLDTTPPEVTCVETVNPHGQNTPPAGNTTLPGPRVARTRTASTSSRRPTTSGRPTPSTSTSTASGARTATRSEAAMSSSTPKLTALSRAARRWAAPRVKPVPSRPTS
ncbi:MAG TPA: hypothetical protein VIF84_01465 [Candidatus Limnocylindrales bacterium]